MVLEAPGDMTTTEVPRQVRELRCLWLNQWWCRARLGRCAVARELADDHGAFNAVLVSPRVGRAGERDNNLHQPMRSRVAAV